MGESLLREKRDEPKIEGLSWVPAEGGHLPEGAFVAGDDSGVELFIARANHEGEIIPGKLIPAHGVAYVPWGGLENAKEQYEVSLNYVFSLYFVRALRIFTLLSELVPLN